MSNVLDQVAQIKLVNTTKPPIPVPPKPKAPKPDTVTLLARKLNNRRDINKTHAFEFWAAYQTELNDYSSFSGFNPAMHRNILIKLNKFSNFYGEDEPDFTNLTIAEQAYYSDFLGINFKKIFHGIGHAATDVAHGFRSAGLGIVHGVRDVTVDVAHGVRDVTVDIAHGARDVAVDVAHGVRDVGEGVGHDVRSAAKDIGRSQKWFHKETLKLDKWSRDEAGYIAKAVAPYWKVIVAVAVGAIIEIASAGTLTPLAIAATSAILTGLDAIKGPQPPLGGAGSGGGDLGPGGDGSGFPTGSDPNANGDPTNGLTPEQQQVIAAQQQAQAQAQADYEAAVKKHHKRIMWAIGLSITAIIIAFIIWRKRRKK